MKNTLLSLLAAQCLLVACHPYDAAALTPAPLALQTTASVQSLILYDKDDREHKIGKYWERGVVEARAKDTTSTTSSTSTTTSTTTTSSTTSTTTYTTSSTTTSSTTTSTTTSTTISSTSTSTSATTTTGTATTTSSTSTATSTETESAELKEWNRRGNIAAIVVSCCIFMLFVGVGLLYCQKDRAKAKRIAARKLREQSEVQKMAAEDSAMVDSDSYLLADRQLLRAESPLLKTDYSHNPLQNSPGRGHSSPSDVTDHENWHQQ